MAMGIIPARGPWQYRRSQLTTSSQGQFQRGDLVCLDHARLASLYTSTQSGLFGVATHDSLNSLPTGYATIAVPLPGATAYVDSLTTDAASSFSFGQAGSIITRYGRTSCLSMQPAGGSAFSFICQVVGPMDSTLSRIEVQFLQQSLEYASVSSSTLNN